MNFLGELETSLSNSAVDAAGAGLMGYMFMDDASANINFLGIEMPFFLAIAVSVMGAEALDKMLLPYARDALPTSWRPWLERGNLVGTSVVAGLLPAGLIYLNNSAQFSWTNWLMTSFVILVGIYAGEYLFDKVIQPRTAEHIN